MKGKIHPAVAKFLQNRTRERQLLSSFISTGFDVTWANERIFFRTAVTICFLRPSTELSETYGIEYEVVLAYSRYPNLEPRTLRAVDHVFSSDPAKGRVEPMWYFLISESKEAENWISSYLTEHKESRIVVSFSANELIKNKSDDWYVRNHLHKHFLMLDRFKYTLPLREDTYFFGRKTELGKLLDFVKRSENVGVFGLRKTGKTSILLKIQRLLQSDDNHAVLLVDAQSPDIRKRRWNQLLEHLAKQLLHIVDTIPHGDFNELDATEHFRVAINTFLSHEKWDRVTVAFDEIEWITPGTARDLHWNEEYLEFWQVIRTVQTRTPRFSVVLAGVNPSIVEVSRFGLHQNPLFGIVTPLFLGGLESEETTELIKKIGKIMGLNFSQDAIDFIYSQYAGHPLLTRLACSNVAELAKASKEQFPIKVARSRLQRDQSLRDSELVFYVHHVVDELERFYPDEYRLLEMLSVGEYQEFRMAIKGNQSGVHLFRYGIVSDPEYPHITYDVVQDFVANENARREGRTWKYKLINTGDREKFLRLRMKDIVEDIRDLERLATLVGKPSLYGPNSFPEAEKLFLMQPAKDSDSLGSALTILFRCFVESIDRYGIDQGNNSYFWNDIKMNYPDLHVALHKIRVYRNNSQHLELLSVVEKTLRVFLEQDLDESLAASNERYWCLLQRSLDSLFLSVQREISKMEFSE